MEDLDAILRRGRGAVFHWENYQFEDPEVAAKGKFLVLLNAFLPDDPLYYVLTTSQVEKLLRSPFKDDAVVFEEGSYSFFNRRTAVNVGTAGAQVSAEKFRGMYYDGEIQHVGKLSSDDVKRLDAAISASQRVRKEIKRHITAW